MDKTHLSRIESGVRQLSGTLGQIGSTQKDIEEMLKVIHKPGWTTIAEADFATGILDSLVAQAKSVLALCKTFVETSRVVGTPEKAGGVA